MKELGVEICDGWRICGRIVKQKRVWMGVSERCLEGGGIGTRLIGCVCV